MAIHKGNIDHAFLIRVIKNEVSREEKATFDAWREESSENQKVYDELLLLWNAAGKAKVPPIPHPQIQFNSILTRIEANNKENQKNNRAVGKIFNNKNIYVWPLRAAAVLVTLASVYMFVVATQHTNKPVMVQKPVDNLVLIERITPKGIRSTVRLSDGSIVFLNADSRLRYPKEFSGKSREVELSGEAYFDIHRDKSKPFRVRTGETTTEVTGTEFNINYRDDRMNLSVSEGSVKSYKGEPAGAISIKRGQMLTYNASTGFSAPKKADLTLTLAWRENKIGFDNTPLEEVMQEIERIYNVKTIFKNKQARNRRISGMFETKDLDGILSLISFSMDLKIDHKGRLITIN